MDMTPCRAYGRRGNVGFDFHASNTRRPIFVNYDLNQIPSLPRVLGECAIPLCLSMVTTDFSEPRERSSIFGLVMSISFEIVSKEENIGWGVSDREVLISLFRDPTTDRARICPYITSTHHHPYDHVGRAMGNIDESIEANTLKSSLMLMRNWRFL